MKIFIVNSNKLKLLVFLIFQLRVTFIKYLLSKKVIFSIRLFYNKTRFSILKLDQKPTKHENS
jgi:hypothetical protein